MKIIWDAAGEKKFETGVSKGVFYKLLNGVYQTGVPWNGLTAVTETPSGADVTDLWADDIKYASLRAAEAFGGTVEAYTFPEEFEGSDGYKTIAPGVVIGQQARDPFGFSYVTQIGSDTVATGGSAYKIHLVYGATVSPSERSYQTINDSPDAITFSWEFSTNPVPVTGQKPTASVTIDSTKIDAEKLARIEAALYGTDSEEPKLLLPDEIISIMNAA